MWSECLKNEIEEEFSLREGCLGRWRGGTGLHLVRKYDGETRDRAGEWRRAKARGLELHNAKRRMRRLKTRIEQWTADCKNICVGRGLDPEKWVEVLTNPVSAVELEAFADFCFFLLRCRKMTPERVAGMLQTNVSEVRAAIAGRVQK